MKKIINGIVYDTEEAKKIASNEFGKVTRYDFPRLYMSNDGNYFFYRHRMMYGEDIESIAPVERNIARKWAKENLLKEDYQSFFGFYERTVIFGERYFRDCVFIHTSESSIIIPRARMFRIAPGEYKCFALGDYTNERFEVEGIGISLASEEIKTELDDYEKIDEVRVIDGYFSFNDHRQNDFRLDPFFAHRSGEWKNYYEPEICAESFSVKKANGVYPVYALKKGNEICAILVLSSVNI